MGPKEQVDGGSMQVLAQRNHLPVWMHGKDNGRQKELNAHEANLSTLNDLE